MVRIVKLAAVVALATALSGCIFPPRAAAGEVLVAAAVAVAGAVTVTVLLVRVNPT